MRASHFILPTPLYLALFWATLFLGTVFSASYASTVLEQQSFETGTAEPLRYTIYLPEGYDRDQRSYPVVYLLHGYGGADTDWVRFGDAA